MKAISKVFIRVLVIEFYRINAGFFFVAVGICFGFLSGREHNALAQAFVSSYPLLLIPTTIWLLYTIKVTAFNQLALGKNENSFLYPSFTLPIPQLARHLVSVAVGQLLPILAYGAFLVITAIRLHQTASAIIIIACLIFLTSLAASTIWRELKHPGLEKSISFLRHRLNTLFTRPFAWFYPEWVIRHQPVAVIGVKLCACLLIIGVSRLYLFDAYDERLMAMGCTLAFAFNLVLVFFYHRFENFHFAFLRSLPFTIPSRLISFLIALIILNIPEVGTLINYFPSNLSVAHLVSLGFYGCGLYMAAYGALFIKDITMDQFINKVFVGSFAGIVLILFGMPVFVITPVLLAAGIFIFKKHFYVFEFSAETASEK